MKSDFNPEQMSKTIGQFQIVHEAISLVRSCLKELEALTFTLEGDVFGDLTVIRRHSTVLEENGLFIAAWDCECSCGTEMIVSHIKLLNETITHCGCKND